jgi:predicted 3-demethylubiquinone-9 3-methyltransferase (glyoxalase superfamily)
METLIKEEKVSKIRRGGDQKITPFLWFENQAVEAVNFYVSVFRDSKVNTVTRYGESGAQASGRHKGSVMTVSFRIEGQEFVAINGGPVFKISPAISFVVNCDTQEEIDYYWTELAAGGDEKAQQCGWLMDKFGVSWQIVPSIWGDMLNRVTSDKAEKLMEAVLKMKKLDLKILMNIYENT